MVINKLRRFCQRNGLTLKQQLFLTNLINERIEELRCPACGTRDGCGCSHPGWAYYKTKKTYQQLEKELYECQSNHGVPF